MVGHSAEGEETGAVDTIVSLDAIFLPFSVEEIDQKFMRRFGN